MTALPAGMVAPLPPRGQAGRWMLHVCDDNVTVDGVVPGRAGRFTLKFRDPVAGWRREPLVSCAGTRFEDVAPVRPFRFDKCRRSFAGLWYFETTGDHVGFESWLERPVNRTSPGQATFSVTERDHKQ